MKAVRFHEHGGSEKLVYEEAPDLLLSSGEALVRVKACSINHLDIWIRQGIPAYPVALPHIGGADISGIVERVGEGVEGVAVGEKVFVAPGLSCFRCPSCFAGHDNLCRSFRIMGAGCHGGYAEYTKAPARDLLPIPPGLSFEEAAAFPLVFLTAWHMLISRVHLLPGEKVLIMGAGSGVGTAAIQIARLAGAQVIAAAGADEKVEKAQGLGADEGINYRHGDMVRLVKEMTGGKGVDVVFDHVGKEMFEQGIALLARGGRYVTCGATAGAEALLDLRFLFARELSLFGSYMGTRAELVTITRLIGEKKLRPVIDSVYPLREARYAQERMMDRKVFGKLILVP